MLDAKLISEIGVIIVLIGGVIAFRSQTQDQIGLQTVAGLLLTAGFAFFGVALSVCCR